MSESPFGQIEELIAAYGEFCGQDGGSSGGSLEEFGAWLVSRFRHDTALTHGDLGKESMLLGMNIVSLHNLAKSKMNKLVGRTPFSSVMDYLYLVLLDSHGQQTKSDLITMSNMEMSSGIEVVRRLLRNGWITESANPADRRSTIVDVTITGKKMVEHYRQPFADFYASLSPGLSKSQRRDALASVELLVAAISKGRH